MDGEDVLGYIMFRVQVHSLSFPSTKSGFRTEFMWLWSRPPPVQQRMHVWFNRLTLVMFLPRAGQGRICKYGRFDGRRNHRETTEQSLFSPVAKWNGRSLAREVISSFSRTLVVGCKFCYQLPTRTAKQPTQIVWPNSGGVRISQSGGTKSILLHNY